MKCIIVSAALTKRCGIHKNKITKLTLKCCETSQKTRDGKTFYATQSLGKL